VDPEDEVLDMKGARKKVLHIFRKGPVVRMFVRFVLEREELRTGIDHSWLFKEDPKDARLLTDLREQGQTVIEYFGIKNKIERLRTVRKAIKEADMVIYHALVLNPADLLLLNISRPLIKKIRWIVWGYDLYFHLEPNKRPIVKITEAMKRSIAKRVPVLGCLVPGDFLLAKEWYGATGEYRKIQYPLEFDYCTLDRSRDGVTTKDRPRMLLGNSAIASNRHFEALEVLEGQRTLQEFKVICPLSYGDVQYGKSVAKKGKELLSDDFEPLFDFLEFEDYAKLLANVDAAWMNHKRQQALGNIVALLYLGKKVFLDGSTTSFAYFKDLGVSIFDSRELDGKKRIDLKLDEGAASRNAEIIKKEFSRDGASKLWVDLFRS